MYSRHELLWLHADGWNAALSAATPSERWPIARWRDNDWPAVVRRRDIGCGHDEVCAGIALPPDAIGAKRRIGVRVARSAVRRSQGALPLQCTINSAPAAWRHGLEQLNAAVPLQVYGSLALQTLTGQGYLRAGSDIDILLRPTTVSDLEHGLRALAACPLPLDGEVVFPGGAAVAWKEWHAAGQGTRVLMKDAASVRLARRAELLELLE